MLVVGCIPLVAWMVVAVAMARQHLDEDRRGVHVDEDAFYLFAGADFLSDADIPGTETAMFEKADEWKSVMELISSGKKGGYHFHDRLLMALSEEQAGSIVKVLQQNKVSVSIEAGGYLCNGTKLAEQQLLALTNYTSAGGYITQWAFESIFSRTFRGCLGKLQTFEAVSKEAVAYAQVLLKAMPQLEFGLIDAVPHFTAGHFGANSSRPLGDIRDALSTLKRDLAAVGIPLQFYWADCPYEYSIAMGGNLGYEKLAFIANFTTNGLGIRMGKIFNSQMGGEVSNEMFYTRTVDDHHRYMMTVPLPDTSDIIVESWYKFPHPNIPETTPYTFMFTANRILSTHRLAKRHHRGWHNRYDV